MPERSVVVTADLQRAIRRDFIRYTLGRPNTLITLISVSVLVLVVSLVTAGDRVGIGIRLPVAVVVIVLADLLLISSVRRRAARGIAALFPVGSTTSVAVEEDALRSVGPRGEGRTRWSSYRSLAVRSSIVLLRLRDTLTVIVVPRSLVDDDDLATMRARIEPGG